MLSRKSTGCSSRGHGSLQLSVTGVPGDPVFASGLLKYQTHIWYTDVHIGQTPAYLEERLMLAGKKTVCPPKGSRRENPDFLGKFRFH